MSITETDRDPFAFARQSEDDDRDPSCPTRSDAELAELVVADPEVQRCIKEIAGIMGGLAIAERERGAGGGDKELFALIAEYRRQEREVNTPKERSEEEIDQLSDELRAVRDKIDEMRPRTLRGVLAVLDLGADLIDDPDWWPEAAIEGLREIVEHGEGGQ